MSSTICVFCVISSIALYIDCIKIKLKCFELSGLERILLQVIKAVNEIYHVKSTYHFCFLFCSIISSKGSSRSSLSSLQKIKKKHFDLSLTKT